MTSPSSNLRTQSSLQKNRLNPICLPDFDETDNMFAYGLGDHTVDGKKVRAEVMHEAELTRITTEKCRESYPIEGNYTVCTLDENTKTGICVGDSGTPLSTRKNGQVYQIGLAHSVVNCQENGQEIFANFFEKVLPQVDWIRKNTEGAQFCEGSRHPFAKP